LIRRRLLAVASGQVEHVAVPVAGRDLDDSPKLERHRRGAADCGISAAFANRNRRGIVIRRYTHRGVTIPTQVAQHADAKITFPKTAQQSLPRFEVLRPKVWHSCDDSREAAWRQLPADSNGVGQLDGGRLWRHKFSRGRPRRRWQLYGRFSAQQRDSFRCYCHKRLVGNVGNRRQVKPPKVSKWGAVVAFRAAINRGQSEPASCCRFLPARPPQPPAPPDTFDTDEILAESQTANRMVRPGPTVVEDAAVAALLRTLNNQLRDAHQQLAEVVRHTKRTGQWVAFWSILALLPFFLWALAFLVAATRQ
jgi:hypothetical protein